MDKPLPPSFRQIGEILIPIFARAEEQAKRKQAAIMAHLLIGLQLDLSDELRCLQRLIVDRLWPGTRQEVEELFDHALDIARALRDSEEFRNGQG